MQEPAKLLHLNHLAMDDYFLGIRLMIELICNDFDDDLVLLPNVSKEIKDKLK